MAVIHLRPKGQITLPKRLRDAVGLGESGTLLVYTEGSEIIMRPLPSAGRLSDLAGILPARPDIDLSNARKSARSARVRHRRESGSKAAQGLMEVAVAAEPKVHAARSD